jgi:hypothetical protein
MGLAVTEPALTIQENLFLCGMDLWIQVAELIEKSFVDRLLQRLGLDWRFRQNFFPSLGDEEEVAS